MTKRSRKCLKVVSGTVFSVALTASFSFSQVVINEVHPRPVGGDTDQAFQSMYNATVTSGAEFIELFNTDACNAVDISCWTIGGMDGGTNGGAFSFPSGTVIPPLGFITLGGPVTPGLTFNLNDPANASRLWRSNANRWHLPNGDGWLSLYDASGVSVDAVYWTFASNDPNKLNTDPTFTDGVLQRIAACGGGGLNTASGIPGIAYISMATVTGQSYERTTDGGATWALGTATPNNCNGICLTASNFSLNASVTNPECNQSNGSIILNPSPAGNYTYNWSPNVGAGNQATNLGAGSYSVSISLNGCSVDTTIQLTSVSGISSIVTELVNPSCNQVNGSVTISAVNGGTGPYSYNFDGQGFTQVSEFSGLAANVYSLEVSDANGCLYATIVELIQSDGPQSVEVTVVDENCGAINGSVQIESISGGVAPYQYNFNNLGPSSNTWYTGLPAGNYSLEIIDANGCVYVAPEIVISNTAGPSGIVINSSDPTCGESNGSISLGAVTGGTPTYQYNLNNQGFTSSSVFDNLTGGSYQIVVQDANGCQYTAPIVVLNTSSGISDINVIVENASCDEANGSITVSAIMGGNPPYLYSLNNGVATQTSVFVGLSGGDYTIGVSDAAGCFLNEVVVVSGGSGPVADFTLNPGVVDVTDPEFVAVENASGDVVTYEWVASGSNPSVGNGTTFSGSLAGNEPGIFPVMLIVTNADGCKDTITKLLVLQSNPLFFAPNAFTPDGDEYNNTWNVVFSGLDEHAFHLTIFNRWGEMIFESFDPNAGWDGSYQDKLVKEGIYTWVVEIKDLYTDKHIVYNGHMSVLR